MVKKRKVLKWGKNKSLSDRMIEYEQCYSFKIPNRSYVIIRLDGKGQNGEPVQRSKWIPDYNIPIFTQDREYLMSLIPKSEIITE